MSDRRKKWIAGGGVAAFLVLTLVVFWYVGKPLIQFLSEPERFREWVDDKGVLGQLAFVGMMVLQVIVAIIPGEPLEIGAGYAFGAVEGTLLCLAGAVIGGALVFLFVRRFGVKAVEVFFPREKIESMRFLQDSQKLNLLVFIVLFIPGTPKDIICYCVGLTKMRFRTWLLISAVARIPSIVTSTISGSALGAGNHMAAAIAFGVTAGISAVGLLIYRRISKKKAQKASADAPK